MLETPLFSKVSEFCWRVLWAIVASSGIPCLVNIAFNDFNDFKRLAGLLHGSYFDIAREVVHHYQVIQLVELKQICCNHLPRAFREGGWHYWLGLQLSVFSTNLAILDHVLNRLRPGHQIEAFARSLHLAIPWCPSCTLSSTCSLIADGTTILDDFINNP